MEGGNTNEYANLILKIDEHGNPVVGADILESGREGLSTNVGYATGGAGCHYDFGGAAAYLNQSGSNDVGGGGSSTNTGGGAGKEQTPPVFGTAVGTEQRRQLADSSQVTKDVVNK